MSDELSFAFDDHKAPDALRTIGEVATALNIRQHVLRYWEEQFPMLRPVKRSGGRRYYRPEDVALLATIDRLVHREGYTLRGARLAIEAKGKAAKAAPAPVAAPVPVPVQPISVQAVPNDGVVVELRQIRAMLESALAA